MRIIFSMTMLLWLGFSSTIKAQEATFGVKTGLNFSKFSKYEDLDGRTGYFIGALIDIELSNEQFHIQPEVLYSREGSDEFNVDYIRILGIGKYYPVKGLSLEAGPQIGIRIFETEIEGLEGTFKPLHYGLSFGVGYEIPNIGLLFNH